VSYPSPGQPWQPDQSQPPYEGGYSGGPTPQSGTPWGDQYGGDPGYGQQQPYSGGPAYPQESYTTEPPYGSQPYDQGYAAQQPGYPASGYQGSGYQGYAAQQPAQPPAYPAAPQSFPPPGQPGYGAPTPPRRGNGGLIAALAGAAVLVLLICGIGAVALLRSDNESDVSTDPSRGTTAGSSTPPSPTRAAEYPASLSLPEQVAGMNKVNSPQLNETANSTATKLKTRLNADHAIAGYYAPPGDPTRAVGLVGVTTRIANPDAELKTAFSSTLNVTGVQDVDPGPLGGIMRCGNTSSGGSALTVCGWADGGSLAIGIFINRSLSESATVFRQIRGEILHRG
jgi:hypothetical protein